MKSSDLPRDTVSVLNFSNDAQELQRFNSHRASRGLQPVTQAEYNELTYKVGTIWSKALSATTIH